MSASGALPISISNDLRRSLVDWNERMGVLVRTPEGFSPAELGEARSKLNEEGLHLARRIEAEHNGQVTVQFLGE